MNYLRDELPVSETQPATIRNTHQSQDLSQFSVGAYKAGPKWKVIMWYFFNYYFIKSAIPWPYSLKRNLLQLFGARIGKGLVLKPGVRIKNPWRLTVGKDCWIGESVWIDNLEDVNIGDNVCLSQDVVLLTGNHDYSLSNFPYRLGKITIENGVWIGARSVICAGVTCRSHSVLTVNSVATKDLIEWGIHSGNPASFTRQRKMKF